MAYDKYVLAKVGGMTKDIYLYTEFKENWQYFFKETTMVPDLPGSIDKVLDVKQHLRRRGPGDPNPITVRATRRFFARYAKTKGSARPGFTIKVGEREALGTGYRELRQFAVQGTLMDLWAYAEAKAKMQLVLWGPNGWSSSVDAAPATQTLAPSGRALMMNAPAPNP
jgi:hypothetical protein